MTLPLLFVTPVNMPERLASKCPKYHIQLEAVHAIHAQACLGVLLQLDNHVNRDSIKSFPLAHYGHHLRCRCH